MRQVEARRGRQGAVRDGQEGEAHEESRAGGGQRQAGVQGCGLASPVGKSATVR